METKNNAGSLNRNILDFHDDIMEVTVYWSRMVYANNESLLTREASHTFFELHYIINGSIKMRLGDTQSMDIHKNEFIIVPPAKNHEITVFEPDTVKFVMGFSFLSKQPDINKAIEAINLLKIVKATDILETSVRLLQKVSSENDTFLNEQLQSLLRFFLLALLSAEINSAGLHNPESSSGNRKFDVRMSAGEEILAYIRMHPVGLTVQELADHFHFSTRQINRVLMETHGKSAGKLLQEEKVLYIKKLLTQTNFTESAIAEICHFANASSMNRFFRKYEKSSVSQFKKDINL